MMLTPWQGKVFVDVFWEEVALIPYKVCGNVVAYLGSPRLHVYIESMLNKIISRDYKLLRMARYS